MKESILTILRKELGNYQRFNEEKDTSRPSLRNMILGVLNLCTCTNTMHGHREGIHSFGKVRGYCDKCRVRYWGER